MNPVVHVLFTLLILAGAISLTTVIGVCPNSGFSTVPIPGTPYTFLESNHTWLHLDHHTTTLCHVATYLPEQIDAAVQQWSGPISCGATVFGVRAMSLGPMIMGDSLATVLYMVVCALTVFLVRDLKTQKTTPVPYTQV